VFGAAQLNTHHKWFSLVWADPINCKHKNIFRLFRNRCFTIKKKHQPNFCLFYDEKHALMKILFHLKNNAKNSVKNNVKSREKMASFVHSNQTFGCMEVSVQIKAKEMD